MPTQKQVASILDDYEKTDHFFVATKKYLDKEDAEITQYDYFKLMSYYITMQSLPGKSQISRNNINEAWERIKELFRPVLGDELFENLENFKESDLNAYKTQMGQMINIINKISHKSPEQITKLKSHPNLIAALAVCLDLELRHKISIPSSLVDAIISYSNINALQEDWSTLQYAGADTPRNLVLLVHGDQTAKQLVDEYHLYKTAPILHDDYINLNPDKMGEHIATLIRQNPKDSEIGFIEAMQQIKIANDYQNKFNSMNKMTADEAEEHRLSRHSPDPFSSKADLNKAKKELGEIKKERTDFQLMTTEEKVNRMADMLKALYHPDWNETDMVELKKPIRTAMHEVILNDTSKTTEPLEFDLEKTMQAKQSMQNISPPKETSEREKNFSRIQSLAHNVAMDLTCKASEHDKLGHVKASIITQTVIRESRRFSKAIDELRQGVKTLDEVIPQINTFVSFCVEREQTRQNLRNEELDVSGISSSKVESTQQHRGLLDEMKYDSYHKEQFEELQECIAVVMQDYGVDDSLDDHLKAGV